MRRTLVPAAIVIIVLLLPTLISFTPNIQAVKAQNDSASFSDDFSSDSSAWQYLGSAHRDPANQYIVLTPSSNQQAGFAFFKAPIQGSFTANFRYKAGGGNWQGDGFTMLFYKQKYSTVDSGDSGNRLGFNSISIIPGYGIEFDGWQNIPWDFQGITGGQPNPPGDPSANHVALIQDYTGNHLTSVNDTRVADNNWHKVSVSVQGSSVSVSIDQAVVLEWSGTLNRTCDGFGFSGATGGVGSNWHIIDDFSIISQNLKTPTLATSCISPQSQSGFNVFKINGDLTFNGAGISGEPIYLYYSVNGGETWQELTLLYTHNDGSYSALWLPTVTGNYLLKSVYKGSENYLGTSNTIIFAIEPFSEQSVFSITSNSTLTELSFDSASNQLSVTVSGASGTTGYVNVYIPTSIMNDISGLKVYLDSNQIDFISQSQSDCWLISFTYHNSSHSVTISLGSSIMIPSATTASTQTAMFGLSWVEIAILVFMTVIVATVVSTSLVLLRRKKPE
jgi:hypothetical protein